MGPRPLHLVLSALLAVPGSCSRSTEDWKQDLVSHDPWRREMAVIALRSVPDEDVVRAVVGLIAKARDRDPRVARAAEDSLRELAPRAVPKLAALMRNAPPEKARRRELCARLLLERARDGDEAARAALAEQGLWGPEQAAQDAR